MAIPTTPFSRCRTRRVGIPCPTKLKSARPLRGRNHEWQVRSTVYSVPEFQFVVFWLDTQGTQIIWHEHTGRNDSGHFARWTRREDAEWPEQDVLECAGCPLTGKENGRIHAVRRVETREQRLRPSEGTR